MTGDEKDNKFVFSLGKLEELEVSGLEKLYQGNKRKHRVQQVDFIILLIPSICLSMLILMGCLMSLMKSMLASPSSPSTTPHIKITEPSSCVAQWENIPATWAQQKYLSPL